MPDTDYTKLAEALELARAIAEGQGDDREGWYGAVEAQALARALLAYDRERQEAMRDADDAWAREGNADVMRAEAEAKLAACDRERQDMASAAAALSVNVTALSEEARRYRDALECFHDEGSIEYVERNGKTWNRCRDCGLLELWEGGMRCAVEVEPRDALTAGDKT